MALGLIRLGNAFKIVADAEVTSRPGYPQTILADRIHVGLAANQGYLLPSMGKITTDDTT